MTRPRVLLAEDKPVMAAELRALLEAELEVVATVADGAALVAAADRIRPDVIVTDIVMPHRSGIDATAELLRRHPETRVVLVTVHDDPALVERGRAAGALGHVLKVAAATDLMPAVRAALRNERYVSSRLRGRPSERQRDGRG
jgi:DNA-binding NarL/FixJ family response regulator